MGNDLRALIQKIFYLPFSEIKAKYELLKWLRKESLEERIKKAGAHGIIKMPKGSLGLLANAKLSCNWAKGMNYE